MFDEIGETLLGVAAFTVGTVGVSTAGVVGAATIGAAQVVRERINEVRSLSQSSETSGKYTAQNNNNNSYTYVDTSKAVYDSNRNAMMKCVSCRAILMGKINEMVVCEYCDTRQVLMDERS